MPLIIVAILAVGGAAALVLPGKKIEIGTTEPNPVPPQAIPAGTLTPFNIAVIGGLLIALLWLAKKAKVI